jgi:hypothetical protein
VLAYWRERLPIRTFGPVAAAIACPTQLAGFRGTGALAIDTALAWLLLAQFRLWDDLVDREADRKRHPNRVLARTAHVGRYVLLCLTLTIVNVLALRSRERPEISLPLLAALTLALAVAYTEASRSPALDLIRLAKYPVFVLVVAASQAGGATAASYVMAIAAFVVAVTYEIWHDPETPLRLLERRSR